MKTPLSIAHISGVALTAFLTVLAIYLSRFWIWTAPWGNDGLFGLKLFRPFGDSIRAWLGGTWLRDFDILIWGVGTILVLSILQIITRRISK